MLRTFLICLLVLALPAQGVMAATMVFCGPNHHDRAVTAAAARDADATHQHQRQQSFNAHSHDSAAHSHAEDGTADESATPDKFAQSDLQKCSACASCCSAAAIHDTVPKLYVPESVAAHFPALAPTVEPFAADGPDRPPRHILA